MRNIATLQNLATFTGSISSPYSYTPWANTMGYYKMNGDSTDGSSNWRNWTDTSMSYVAGRFNQCASFNGTTSSILFNMPTVSPFTRSLWLNHTVYWAAQSVIDKLPANWIRIWTWTTRWGGIFTFNWTNIAYTQARVAGTWYHVCLTFTGGTAVLYINGVANTTQWGLSFTDNSNLYLGRQSWWSNYLNGKIDEVIIENVARTWPQVLAYYNNQNAN